MADIKNRAKDIFNKAKNIYNGDNIKRSKAELSNARDSYFYTKKLKEQKSKEFKDYLDFANGWGVIPLKKRRDYWTPKHERKLNEFSKNFETAKKNLKKEETKTNVLRGGVAAGTLAGTLGIPSAIADYAIKKNYKKDNSDNNSRPISVKKGVAIGALLGAGLSGIRHGTHGYNLSKSLGNNKKIALRDALEYAKEPIFKNTLKGGALGGTVNLTRYGINKHKKNKEKTAYDIVVEAFEKIAVEEEKKANKQEDKERGSRRAATIGGNIGALLLGSRKAINPDNSLLDTAIYSVAGSAIGANVGKGVYSVASKLKAKKNKEKTA